MSEIGKYLPAAVHHEIVVIIIIIIHTYKLTLLTSTPTMSDILAVSRGKFPQRKPQ